MRTVDDIANDYANADSDAERAALIREMDAVNAVIAASHLADGNVTEYEWVIGHTRQAHRTYSNDSVRVLSLMAKGKL